MAQTLVNRELFDGQATFSNASPGSNLGTIPTGSFYRRERGARTAAIASPGFSGELRDDVIQTIFTRSLSNLTFAFAIMQFHVKRIRTDGSNSTYILYFKDTAGNITLLLAINPAGNLTYKALYPGGSYVDTGLTIPLNTDFWLGMSIENLPASNNCTAKIYYQLAAGPLTQLGADITIANSNATINEVTGGAGPAGGGTCRIIGRISGLSVYSLANGDTPTFPADLLDPPALGRTFYFNPATGSNSNDGLSAGSQKQTIGEFNLQTRYAGFLIGDTVKIDNSVTPMDFGTTVMEIATDGLIVDFMGGTPKFHKDVSGGVTTWTVHDTNVWKTTDGSASDLTGVVIWEDDKWLNHVNGANIAAVLTTMKANAGGTGQFFSDSGTIYYVGSDNSNPNSNGKTLHRSRNRSTVLGSASGGSAAPIHVVNAANVSIIGLYAPKAKTCLCQSSDGDGLGGYVIDWDLGCSGTANVERNCTLGYWGKHGSARTTAASNMKVNRYNIWYEQGSPYVGSGGQTAAVDYCAGSGTGNKAYYYRCGCLKNAGLVGSAAGTNRGDCPGWLMHGDANNNFSLITMVDCYWSTMLDPEASMSGGVFKLVRTRYPSISTNGNGTNNIVRRIEQPNLPAEIAGE